MPVLEWKTQDRDGAIHHASLPGIGTLTVASNARGIHSSVDGKVSGPFSSVDFAKDDAEARAAVLIAQAARRLGLSVVVPDPDAEAAPVPR